MIIKTRAFYRVVVSGNMSTAIAEVQAEVNAFLATLPIDRVLDIVYNSGPAASQVHYIANVVYME